jgi:hypothetical protein
MLVMRASGANGFPFSMPTAATKPYIGRNSSNGGSSSSTLCSFCQNRMLSSHRSSVMSTLS